jgi:SOS-response transcriptional repressor LexA
MDTIQMDDEGTMAGKKTVAHRPEPTPLQAVLISKFLLLKKSEGGKSPSLRQIATAMGYRSASRVLTLMREIEAAGLATRTKGRNRSYEIAEWLQKRMA